MGGNLNDGAHEALNRLGVRREDSWGPLGAATRIAILAAERDRYRKALDSIEVALADRTLDGWELHKEVCAVVDGALRDALSREDS
jgi:hypothetical protein